MEQTKQLLENIQTNAIEAIEKARSADQLEQLEVRYLGRKGEVTEIMHTLKSLTDEEKRVIGPLSNSVKNTLTQKIAPRRNDLESVELEKQLQTEFFDISIPGKHTQHGHIHPLNIVQMEVEKIFSDMGFSIADGPDVESEYFNFESLNVPASHPARDMQDTFFVSDKHHDHHGRMVMRTQTSPVQVRTMQAQGAPLRIIVPGRVFRYEATDASHDSAFNQVEGLLIDENISLAHLKGVMKEFLQRLFKKEVNVRFRPGYFPFVEPGLELDFSCLICDGKGCSVCKKTGWVEFMGAGMVHPNVLKAGGIDSTKYQGWAFGFGLTRLVMMKYRINDCRLILSGDLRFLNQF